MCLDHGTARQVMLGFDYLCQLKHHMRHVFAGPQARHLVQNTFWWMMAVQAM